MRRQVQKTFCKSSPCARKANPVRGAPPSQTRPFTLLMVPRCNNQFDILWLSDGRTILYILPTHSHIGYSGTGHAWLASDLRRLRFLCRTRPLAPTFTADDAALRLCLTVTAPQMRANPSVQVYPQSSCVPVFALRDQTTSPVRGQALTAVSGALKRDACAGGDDRHGSYNK